MSELDKCFHYIFMWYARADACPKCRALDGRRYRGQDLFAPVLVDPQFGPVWNLDTDQPLTHPNCRCHLEVVLEKVDLNSLEEFQSLSAYRRRWR